MKILYINHYAGSPEYGMEYRPYYLAREWVRAGHSVTIVGASQSHVRRRQPQLTSCFATETIDGVKFIWCKTPAYRGNGIGRVLNIAVFLYRLRQWRKWLGFRPDVVIASSTYPADIGGARAIARQHGSLLVWEVHDLWPLSPIELGGMSPLNPFIIWMQLAENLACRSAELVVSMLPNAGAHLRNHGMESGKLVHVPNGVDPAEWAETSATALPEAHESAIQSAVNSGHLLVAYTGAHGVANALGSMIDAAVLCRNEPITWLLVGSGPEKSGLQKQIAAAALTNVRLLDPLAKSAIPTMLRRMDVLYIGLRAEPLFHFGISPNKLMDYMMAARPVVCAIEAGNDPVRDAGCGLTIPPEDPRALAAAVRKMRAMGSEERDRLGRAGYAHVVRNHTYAVLAQRFIGAVQIRASR